MSRSFRFVPPEPRSDTLPRPRLMRSLVGRWQHRVTSVVGGPGLGKTTLMAQAITENQLAPRGDDVWIGLEPQDADADQLARVVAAAVAGHGAEEPRPAARDQPVVNPAEVADAVWHRSPAEACLVFDDVHLVPPRSTGASWLGQLVDALPANGHVVLVSRTEPPIRLARFGTQRAVLRLAEEDLRFSEEELFSFAERRGLDPRRFGDTGGWPAMAELAASVDQPFTGAYLWEEVLEPLGTVRRHVLAVLSDLGGGDAALISAAVGTPVDLARALDGVPLVARGADGWHVPHALWRTAPGLSLPPTERSEIRRRAAEELRERGRFDDAFSLIAEVELWDAAPAVLRQACLATDRLLPAQLGRWLSASSEAARGSSAGRLATGLYTAFTAPARAVEPLQEAVAQCRAQGDVDAELAAIAQLGQLAWWRQDLDSLGELVVRLFELEPTGHPVARALATIARAAVADLAGHDPEVVAELDRMASGVLDTVWDAYAGWMCGVVHLDRGRPEAVHDIIERLTPTADSATRPIIDALQFRLWWAEGRVDEAISRIPVVMAAEQRAGPTYNFHIGQIFASVVFSYTGDVVAGRQHLDDALTTAPPSPSESRSVQVAVATAALELAEGDEASATAVMREVVEVHGVDQGIERRAWRHALSLSYVLVPEARTYWDEAALRGYLRAARDLSAAVVALREGSVGPRLRDLDLPDLGVVRAALHHRFAAELAVGLAAAGRPEGRALLDVLGLPGRAAVRALATGSERRAKNAKALLAAVPAPPSRPTYLAVLGPLVLRRDSPENEDVVDPDLRRTRLQALVAFLVGHRRTTRAAITAALWPDLDERAAGNNLAVTLSRLLRVLEPWRASGEPSYLVRLDGQAVQLVAGEHLRIDVDEFDGHLAAAARAEADATPSLALDHDLAAVALYRDDLYLDVPEAEWFVLDREHYRTRFVGAAVRAGQLLVGRGDIEQAQTVVHRALAVDPWSEEAYAVLVGAALARGDRSAAHRMLGRCLDVLVDLGVEPSPATRQLRRRVQGIEP
jgi:LuxR family maltose regulon positive regulatory protein